MTQLSTPMPSRGLPVLQTILFILSGLILALGLIVGILLIASAGSSVENMLVPILLMGGGAVANLLRPLLLSLLVNLGAAVIVIALIVSALLYGLGRLIGHTLALEARLARLEARSQ